MQQFKEFVHLFYIKNTFCLKSYNNIIHAICHVNFVKLSTLLVVRCFHINCSFSPSNSAVPKYQTTLGNNSRFHFEPQVNPGKRTTGYNTILLLLLLLHLAGPPKLYDWFTSRRCATKWPTFLIPVTKWHLNCVLAH